MSQQEPSSNSPTDLVPGKQEIVESAKAILGPASTEFGQLLADQIRFWRWRSARNILRRAHEIQKEQRIPSGAVPLKFFLHVIDEASKEDVAYGDPVCDLWANLLASSSEETVGFDLLCINVLKSIGREEVKLLLTCHAQRRIPNFPIDLVRIDNNLYQSMRADPSALQDYLCRTCDRLHQHAYHQRWVFDGTWVRGRVNALDFSEQQSDRPDYLRTTNILPLQQLGLIDINVRHVNPLQELKTEDLI